MFIPLWRIMKYAMKNRYFAITLVALLTSNLYGQNTTASRLSQIDSLISLIPSDVRNNDYFSDIQSSGLIHKRILGMFRKQIGSVSSETIYSDTLVYSSSNYYRYKKDSKIIIEDFYYQNNHLIRYNKELSVKRKTDENRTILHKIVAYFDNQNPIGLSDFKWETMKLIIVQHHCIK